MSVLDEDRTCIVCEEKHGTVADISILHRFIPPKEHLFCLCNYVPMRTKKAGTATKLGVNGADMYLYLYNKLPSFYMNKATARSLDRKDKKGNLDKVLPGLSIGGDIFYNRDNKLPTAPKRIWYEADVDYMGGYRNTDRILYSNDGLIFASYDHFHTFYEITK